MNLEYEERQVDVVSLLHIGHIFFDTPVEYPEGALFSGTGGLHGFCFYFVIVIDIQAPEFLLRTILRRGKDFAFYFDALSEIDQKAYLYAGSLEIIDKLRTMSGMEFLYRLELEDYFALHEDVGHIVANKLGVVIDLDLFFLFGPEASLY